MDDNNTINEPAASAYPESFSKVDCLLRHVPAHLVQHFAPAPSIIYE